MALGQIKIFRAEIIIESEVKLTSLSLYNKPIRRYVRIGFLCYFIISSGSRVENNARITGAQAMQWHRFLKIRCFPHGI